MKKYDDYKLSPVPWIEKIPSHWDFIRNKNFLKERDEKSNFGNEQLLTLSQYTGISLKSEKKEKTGMYESESLVGYKVVHKNDIVMNIMLAWNGSTAKSSYYGIISPAYAVYYVVNKLANPNYLHYLYRTTVFRRYFEAFSAGIVKSRLRLYSQSFLQLFTILPPRDEQEQIVRFLDWKVSEINKLINIRKNQFNQLKLLIDKQFLILSSQAIKEIRLKNLVKLDNDFIQIQIDHYYMKTGMYNRGRGIFRREAIVGQDMGDSSFQKIHAGRVMISGQFAWEAAVYVTVKEDEIGVASHRYYLLNPSNEIPAEYIWCFLMSEYGQLEMKLCSHGAAGRNRPLNIKELLNVYIPMPKKGKELDSIVRNVRHLMRLQDNINKQEFFLNELKTRLIADVVTGKIDVRGIVVPDYKFVAENTDNATDDNEEAEAAEEN